MPLDFALQLPSVLTDDTHMHHKEVVLLPNISIKGPKDREGCLQNRHIVFEKLKSFSVRH